MVKDEASRGSVWAWEACALYCAASGLLGPERGRGGAAGSQGRSGFKNRIDQVFPKGWSEIHCALEIPKHSQSLSINEPSVCHPLTPEFPWMVVVG